MGEQLSLVSMDIDPAASLEPYEVPKAAARKRTKEIWPREQALSPNDPVVLVHRLGDQKEVRFCGMVNHKIALVKWPLANELLEILVATGFVKTTKKRAKLRDWKVEPGALHAIRALAAKMPGAGKTISYQE